MNHRYHLFFYKCFRGEKEEDTDFMGISGLGAIKKSFSHSLPRSFSALKKWGSDGHGFSSDQLTDLQHQHNYKGLAEKYLTTGKAVRQMLQTRKPKCPWISHEVNPWATTENGEHYIEQVSATELIFADETLHSSSEALI